MYEPVTRRWSRPSQFPEHRDHPQCTSHLHCSDTRYRSFVPGRPRHNCCHSHMLVRCSYSPQKTGCFEHYSLSKSFGHWKPGCSPPSWMQRNWTQRNWKMCQRRKSPNPPIHHRLQSESPGYPPGSTIWRNNDDRHKPPVVVRCRPSLQPR